MAQSYWPTLRDEIPSKNPPKELDISDLISSSEC